MITSKPAISIEDKIYYAGLVDGEGYIFIIKGWYKRSKIYYRAGIKIAMCGANDILRKAQGLWGGYLVDRPPRTKKHRPVLEWIIDGNSIGGFLEDIQPYVRVKKDQIDVIVEFRKFVSHNNNVTPSVQEYRTHLFEGLKGLHHSIPFAINPGLRNLALADVHTKRFVSAETIKKLSESHKGKHHAGTFKKGQPSWSAGKKFTEEHKRKIGEANKIALKRYYETNEAWNKKPLV